MRQFKIYEDYIDRVLVEFKARSVKEKKPTGLRFYIWFSQALEEIEPKVFEKNKKLLTFLENKQKRIVDKEDAANEAHEQNIIKLEQLERNLQKYQPDEKNNNCNVSQETTEHRKINSIEARLVLRWILAISIPIIICIGIVVFVYVIYHLNMN